MPSSSEALLEAGLCASWARQVRWSGGGSLHRLGGLLVALSAVPDQTQQVAVVERHVADPHASVLATEALMRSAGWLPAFDLLAGAHPSLVGELERQHYGVVVDRPGMLLDVERTPALRSPAAAVRPARSDERAAVVDVQARAFDLDPVLAGALLPSVAFESTDATVLVAVDEGVMGAVCVHHDGVVAGLIGTAVDPQHQGRGVGLALTLAAVACAAAAGARHVWLQATPAGEGVYQRCGFEDIGSCQVWQVTHDLSQELHVGPRPTGL